MKEKQTLEDIEDITKSVDTSRRRFTKAGLAASGVILTLASRPVLANADCRSPSAWASANISAHFHEMCFGMSPDYYANTPEAWTGTQYLPGTLIEEGDKKDESQNS